METPIESIITIPSKIDQLTLEIMSNKKKYNKILSKTDPQEFKKQQEKQAKRRKFSERILSLTRTLLESPETQMFPPEAPSFTRTIPPQAKQRAPLFSQITHDIQDVFDDYAEACIRYFEMKDYEKKCSAKLREDDDDDVLFGTMDSSSEDEKEREQLQEPLYGSFWGKSIKKIQR